MAQEIESGNPVIGNAQTFENNSEDRRTIEELRDYQGSLLIKLNEVAESRANYIKQMESLKHQLKSTEEMLEMESSRRIDMMNAFEHVRRELEATKRENAMLKMELEKSNRSNGCLRNSDVELKEVMDDLVDNTEDIVEGLRALCSILLASHPSEHSTPNNTKSIKGGE